MIFVRFLDRMTNQYESIRHHAERITLRGYERVSYPAPELLGFRLPVNLLAFNLCKTQRDVYLHVTGQSMPETWERYCGRVMHTLYQEIWKKILEVVSAKTIRSLDLDSSLTGSKEEIIESAFGKHQDVFERVEEKYNTTELRRDLVRLQAKLGSSMDKIFSYEKTLTSALVNFELSSLFNQSPGNPLFQKTLALSIGESYNAQMLGFTNPVTPDFRYRNDVVGDIKTGPWQDYYYHTITAYALAVEAHTKSAVDCGIVLHVDIRPSRKVPIHEHASFEVIDDYKRKRFLTIRDEKLRIAKEKVDPGRPDSPNDCEGCGFYDFCWRDQ
jgi:CRISPR/Cas system-associated exonuclease Cas4 (RecB family)